MLGHLGLNVGDLDVARTYYGALLPLLGFEPFFDHDDEVAWRPAGGKPGTWLFLYPAPGPAGFDAAAPGLQHLAFMVRTRSAVRAARDAAVELGSVVVHEPQVFPQYPQPYYAAFWRDPFGFLVEAVCHHDRE